MTHSDFPHSDFPRRLFYLIIAGACMCGQPLSAQPRGLTAYFKTLPPTDTLRVEVDLEPGLASADTIPNSLFFNALPAALLQEIDHVADSSEALVLGRYHFPLHNGIEAYWVEIRQFWFQHHSLFLYDTAKKTFTDRATLAEWYGGDGGQVLIGSWVFDFDGDGRKDIVRREIQHSMIPDGDTVLERTEEHASLLRWKKNRFTEKRLPQTDKRFPIRSFW